MKTWNDTEFPFEQDLNNDGNDCPSPLNRNYSEDCLYLNVYTKGINATNLRPVIAFIHPGGFYILSGSSSNFGADYLMEEDIVLVTFNYRLAFLGFTSVDSTEGIANAGFKDKSLALAWIQDHIHHFGGDKNSVTLMGYSAGAMSVALHLVSPMSRNYFHRAVIMSGSVLPQIKSPTSQNHLIAKLAQIIDCNEHDIPFECVKQADTQLITNSLRKIFEFGYDNPIYPWLPVVESKTSNENQFLHRDPMELLENGDFNRIPIILSLTKNEFMSSAIYLFEQPNLLHQWIDEFHRLGPICLQYEKNDTISDVLKQHYIKYSADDPKNSFKLFDDITQVSTSILS